jgi:hypothetical protein
MMRGNFTGEKEDKCKRERVRADGGSLESVCVCAMTKLCMCECECGEKWKEDLQPAKYFAVGLFARVVNQEDLAS